MHIITFLVESFRCAQRNVITYYNCLKIRQSKRIATKKPLTRSEHIDSTGVKEQSTMGNRSQNKKIQKKTCIC